MASTLESLLKDTSISADVFGLAALSYIFIAFGDVAKAKEYWPWNSYGLKIFENEFDNITSNPKLEETVKDNDNGTYNTSKYKWETSGNMDDLTRAMLCLKAAQIRSNQSIVKEKAAEKAASIQNIKKRLSQIQTSVNSIRKAINDINSVSSNTSNKITEITQN